MISACDLREATVTAVYQHFGQTDKNGDPYILHVMRVWHGVCSESIETQVTALLHDIVEDTDFSLDDVEEKFGFVVRNAVDALTKRKGENLDTYLDRVCANKIAMKVKRSDSSDNRNRLGAINDVETRDRLRKKYDKVLGRIDAHNAQETRTSEEPVVNNGVTVTDESKQ